MSREQKVIWVTRLVVLGLVLNAVYYALSRRMGAAYPYDTFLFDPDVRFSDFFGAWVSLGAPYTQRDSYGSAFPLLFVLLRAASPLGSIALFGLWAAGCALAFAWFVARSLPARLPRMWRGLALAACCLSYPVLMSLDRGNLELMVWVLLAGFVGCWRREKYLWCAVLLGVCLNFKPFPLLFVLLLGARGQWKHAVASLALAAAIFGASLWWLGAATPSHIQWFKSNLALYNELYAEGPRGLAFGHSLFGALKVLAGQSQSTSPMDVLATEWMQPYAVLALAGAVATAWWVLRFEKVAWKQVMAVVLAMNLLPYVSGDYKLLHLFLPLCGWFEEDVARSPAWDKFYGAMLAALLIPKNVWHLWDSEVTIAQVANPALMLALALGMALEAWSRRGAGHQPAPRSAPKYLRSA